MGSIGAQSQMTFQHLHLHSDIPHQPCPRYNSLGPSGVTQHSKVVPKNYSLKAFIFSVHFGNWKSEKVSVPGHQQGLPNHKCVSPKIISWLWGHSFRKPHVSEVLSLRTWCFLLVIKRSLVVCLCFFFSLKKKNYQAGSKEGYKIEEVIIMELVPAQKSLRATALRKKLLSKHRNLC